MKIWWTKQEANGDSTTQVMYYQCNVCGTDVCESDGYVGLVIQKRETGYEQVLC